MVDFESTLERLDVQTAGICAVAPDGIGEGFVGVRFSEVTPNVRKVVFEAQIRWRPLVGRPEDAPNAGRGLQDRAMVRVSILRTEQAELELLERC